MGYRPAVRAIRRFTVRPVLPPKLAALGDLALNLRWSWHPETQDVFRATETHRVSVADEFVDEVIADWNLNFSAKKFTAEETSSRPWRRDG